MILIISLLFFFNFYEGYYNPETLIWGLSAILTFIAAVSAKPPIRSATPPIRREQTSKISMKNIENTVYNYLKENKRSGFTVYALKIRLENFAKEYKEREHIRENLQMILNNLITIGKIDSTLRNGELYYFVADFYQKKVEELEPVPSIQEKKEEVPKVAPSHELQQVPSISELTQQEASEKATIEVSQLKTEELEPVPSIQGVKEEAPKEYSYTCKFCGMKLTKKANICPQCGTIIKT